MKHGNEPTGDVVDKVRNAVLLMVSRQGVDYAAERFWRIGLGTAACVAAGTNVQCGGEYVLIRGACDRLGVASRMAVLERETCPALEFLGCSLALLTRSADVACTDARNLFLLIEIRITESAWLSVCSVFRKNRARARRRVWDIGGPR